MLLPPDISELIASDAMVRVIDRVVDQIDLAWIDKAYPGGGRPAHNPVMLLKVILYAYSSGVYSSRKIAAMTTKDLHAMWLCGMQPISHNTINRFRKDRLGEAFEKVYAQIIELLADGGFVDLTTYFLDGTKIEAVSGRYTFTWTKASAKFRAKLQQKIHQQSEHKSDDLTVRTAKGLTIQPLFGLSQQPPYLLSRISNFNQHSCALSYTFQCGQPFCAVFSISDVYYPTKFINYPSSATPTCYLPPDWGIWVED